MYLQEVNNFDKFCKRRTHIQGAAKKSNPLSYTVTSLFFSWYAVIVVLMNMTVNNAGVKFTR